MLLLMESKNCAMATNTGSSALKEEEIELELGLSIGGSYTRQNGNKLESDTHIDVGSGEKNPGCIRSSISPNAFIVDAGQEKDQKTKREIHALRRQEAKKKREEKQLKRGSCKANFNGAQLNGENVYNNNGMLLKVKHFQAKEREVDIDERECKKSKKEKSGSDHNHSRNVNLNLTFHQNDEVTNNIGTCFPIPSSSSPVHYPHLPVQYGMPANGFVYPCANVNVMPCCFTGGTTADTEGRNVVQVQPVVSYGFVPFQAVMDPGHNMGNGYDSEQNCSRNGGNKKAGSNGSTKCTSSTGSDHRSSSHEGGGSSSISSYSRSNSSSSMFEQPLLNGSRANDARGQSEHTALSHLTESASGNEASNNVEKLIPSNSSQSSPTGNKDEAKSEIESDPTDNRISTSENPTSTPLIESKGEVGKPPKHVSQNHSTPPLPCMPCVSTTGNGPNGKTINGFLYRYTKTEVSIICVCHGSSFSPAEFVQHAGGTDVSHPLRHITVIPSAF